MAGFFGTGAFALLDPSSFVRLPDGPARAPKTRGTWSVLWHVDQRLWSDPDDPARGLGFYFQSGLGDDDPNPVRLFLSAEVNGNGPIPGREGDTLGVGWYFLGPGGPTKRAVPGLRDESGVELFYNVRVAPGCHLTADLQVIEPGLGPLRDALLLGLRFKVDF